MVKEDAFQMTFHCYEHCAMGQGPFAADTISADLVSQDWLHLPLSVSGPEPVCIYSSESCTLLFYFYWPCTCVCSWSSLHAYCRRPHVYLEPGTKYNRCYRQRHPYLSALSQCLQTPPLDGGRHRAGPSTAFPGSHGDFH